MWVESITVEVRRSKSPVPKSLLGTEKKREVWGVG